MNFDEAKEAFYRTFVGAGEMWFPYENEYTTREESINAVDSVWQEFLEHLQTIREKNNDVET